ncbi:30S ribosomal protein S15 [Candidatus Woesearchaeota archaeon B3_Woes]|nr:MAG: 30S ribosomal protein S15 [Candidatus Woesearchaeota archaeon B3_Woes]
MARMYSRNKGKSKSVKPTRKTNLSWLRYKEKEVELLVTKVAKEGKTASEIGLFLRDNYGIPSVKKITNKSISEILKEKKLAKEIPEDLMALIKRTIMLRKHLEKNHKDETAKRGINLTESKIKRLVKYYKQNKKLSMDWKYDPDKIKLFIE